MNVLIIPPWYPDDHDPVAGVYIKNQVEALAKLNHQVAVLNTQVMLSTADITTSERFEQRNILEIRTISKYLGNPQEALIRYLKFLEIGYQKVLENFEPDIIHAHIAYPSGLGGTVLGTLYNKPSIITEHYGPFEAQLTKKRLEQYTFRNKPIVNNVTTDLVRYAFNHANRLIAVSQDLRQQIYATGVTKRDIDVIPNVVNTDLFIPLPGRVNDTDNRPVHMLFAGFLTRDKGADLLIEAACVLASEGIDFKLFMAGSGNLHDILSNKVLVNKIDNRVKFTGPIRQEELARLMAYCDFFVFPSLHETFGCVLIEAAACGKPIICSAVGVAKEIINPNTGIIVKTGDLVSLVNAIKRMIATHHRYDANRIRQGIKRYSSASVAGQLGWLYKEVLSK